KIFDDKWMRENGFLDEPDPLGTVGELLRRKKQRALISAKKGESVRDVIAVMRDTGFSQLPVLERDGGPLAGIVAESDLLDFLVKGEGGLEATIDALVESDYATVSPATRIALLRNIFNDAKMVLVESGDQIVGVITKIDLIEYLAERRT
ncbi:MAG TPA: CBS domain-containing protein, partial [Polyangia bacterium]|nr:CBS domain-containing protein [Polyangia bacterium]